MSELKPCPFCGAKNVDVLGATTKAVETVFYVSCFKCRAKTNYFKVSANARNAWNKRADWRESHE